MTQARAQASGLGSWLRLKPLAEDAGPGRSPWLKWVAEDQVHAEAGGSSLWLEPLAQDSSSGSELSLWLELKPLKPLALSLSSVLTASCLQ